MKLCYLGVYADGTGYANQAVRNMLALEAGGIDVVARSVKLSQSRNDELAEKVEHLESKTTDNVDVVIQHVLPHLFEYKVGVKNIGMFCWETTHFRKSNWAHCCNMMDEIWVPTIQNVQAAIDSRVTVPVKIFPCACDIKKFDRELEPLNIPQAKDKCVFYTIGEMNRRKNLAGTLRAFYGAFSSRDDVVLIVKTNIPGQSPEETLSAIKRTTDDIKKSMHMYARHSYYPPVIGITDFLPDGQLDQLHVAGDIFVSASKGEAWGIPAHDAMGFGNPVILSNWGSFPELVYQHAQRHWNESSRQFDGRSGSLSLIIDRWLINGQLTTCFGETNSFNELYTGDELWFDPNIPHYVSLMRQGYKEWQDEKLSVRGDAMKEQAARFSYENVGAIAKELLGIQAGGK